MSVFITAIFYICVAVTVPELYKQAIQAKKRKNKSLYVLLYSIALLCLSLIAAFRGGVGSDSPMYRSYYESQNFVRSWDTFESGYVLINRFLYRLGLPYQSLFFLCSFLQNIFIFKAVEHEEKIIDVKLAIFIYTISMYYASFNIMRQLSIVGVCLYAVLLYFDHEIIRSILLIVISTQMHETAYIMLAVIPAKIIWGERRKWLIGLSLAALLYLVFNRGILNDIFFMFTGRHTGYLSDAVATDGNVLMHFLKMSPLMLLAILHFNDYKNDARYYTFFGLYLCGIILESLDYFSNTQVGRIGYYFSYMSIFLFPFIANYRTRITRMFSSSYTKEIIYIWFLVLFMYNYVIKGFGKIVPYFNF